MRRIDKEMDAVFGIRNQTAREEATRLLISLQNKKDRDTLISMLCHLRRADQKWASDRITDRSRRTLVGARLPREIADRYKARAIEENRSLYAWVCEALREKYDRGSDG